MKQIIPGEDVRGVSAEVYEVLSLAARYLFALLGVVIVLRSYTWLLADRAEKHRRLRRLPDAGTIGELLVCRGSRDLPEGTGLPVPWEGELGSVRSCDITVPCEGVKKRHLRFSYEAGSGLRILPESGCEATVDGETLNCRSGEKGRAMQHGSFLQVGDALLRLRIFAGLDFSGAPEAAAGEAPALGGAAPAPGGAPSGPEAFFPRPGGFDAPPPQAFPANPAEAGVPMGYDSEAGFSPREGASLPAEGEAAAAEPRAMSAEAAPAPGAEQRKRRSARWEEDWSE